MRSAAVILRIVSVPSLTCLRISRSFFWRSARARAFVGPVPRFGLPSDFGSDFGLPSDLASDFGLASDLWLRLGV